MNNGNDLIFAPLKRPTFTEKREIPASQLLGELRRFCDEYLKAALVLTIEGNGHKMANVSSEWLAYTVRLMVEKARGGRVIYITARVDTHLTVETDFKNVSLSLTDLTDIAAAGRSCGLHFELRGTRVIFRAALSGTERLPLYATDTQYFYSLLYAAFFGQIY